MTNNFEQIKKHLKFDNDGDCYYIQLLKRQSDDPKIDGKIDPSYHGNMHSRSIKDYYIKSIEDLDSRMEEIITLCKMFNVRAYIRLNKRSYKAISMQLLKHITDQLVSGQTFSSPFHLVSSAAGLANDAGKNKTWIVDLDKEFLPYESEIIDMVDKCDSSFQKNVVDVIPTKSGKHIITHPFNLQKFKALWEASENLQCMKVLDIHKDNPTILYCV